MKILINLIILLTLASGVYAKKAQMDYPIKPVPFTDVQFTDSFWRPRRIAGGKNSRGEGKLLMPKSVVTGSDGVCYVSDSAEGKVVLFDMVGNTLGEIGGSAGLKGPAGLAVDPFGNVFIADTLNGRIVVLDRDGNLLREFTGTSDSDREGFIAPESVAVSNDGLLVVADTGRLSVSCFRLSYR